MNLKPLIALGMGTCLITACSNLPTKQDKVQQPKPVEPIVFTEPAITAPFYALNPSNYSQPPEFEVNLLNAENAPVTKFQISSDPSNPDSEKIILEKNRFIIPLTDSKEKALKFAVLAQDNELDVTEIDDFFNLLEGKARHYPVRFNSNRERDGYTDRLKTIITTLDPLALKSNASYDVLIRAAKASSMARNLDMGEIYGPKALSYAKRLLAMQPKDPTINFWLGFGLSEGGAFKEAIPYLKVAMDAGVQEAHLSMANNYIYMEQKKNAITTLKNYKIKFPSEAEITDQLIQEIESGKRYNVWQISK
ncbi:ABUW_2363 family tetratricopeptide repeat lipoprotein [Acinetobacter puyangensis]|uniref:ABUW_2363 family tetratricopeptide repeat lipoprotein n=1 Tax=Acinetobacter puyangensis TaxID=1096779 RepID=UPI003A4E30F4